MSEGRLLNLPPLPQILMPTTKIRSSLRDCWSTPEAAKIEICRDLRLVPTIDVCADKHNTKCPHFITEEQDALKVSWVDLAKELGVDPVFWMNPPYRSGLIDFFLQKAWEESLQGGIVISLIPPSVDLDWWHNYVVPPLDAGKAFLKFLKGRIEFIPPPGVKASSPRRGNVVVVYGLSKPPKGKKRA